LRTIAQKTGDFFALALSFNQRIVLQHEKLMGDCDAQKVCAAGRIFARAVSHRRSRHVKVGSLRHWRSKNKHSILASKLNRHMLRPMPVRGDENGKSREAV
jgi:hypothetical protein